MSTPTARLVAGVGVPESPLIADALEYAHKLCDPYLFTLTRWLKADGVDSAHFAKVHAHMLLMADRPAVQRALVDEPR